MRPMPIACWAAVLCGLTVAAADAPPAPSADLTAPAERWRLLWHDEFDGDRLDRRTWASTLPFKGDDGTGRHHNRQYLSALADDDITVHDGVLTLASRKVDTTTAPGHTYGYTEGLVHTAGRFAYQYGYLEARCRGTTDRGPGFWPAVWTLAEHAWPPENDVVELWSSGHVHQGFAYRDDRRRVRWVSHHGDVCPAGWHTYGVEWGPGLERFTFDGRVTQTVAGRDVPARPMYVILNSGVSGDRGRAPTAASRWPMTFDVDYVRVWQQQGPATTRPGQ